MDKQQLIDLLKADVVPALGCTEPVCVALSAAHAALQLADEIVSVRVQVNAGIYKNGMSAGIPNCSEVGLNYAAAIGACLKNPERGLELLADLTPSLLEKAAELVKRNAVSVELDEKESGLFVNCTVCTEREICTAQIRGAHTNLVRLEKNGEILLEKATAAAGGGDSDVVNELKEIKISEIRSLVEECSGEELAFMMDGVEMNEALAAYSEEVPTGVGIANVFRREIGSTLLADDLMSRILLKVSSAAESRLDGCPRATMSSSGAGTKGLVVILPVSETAKAVGASVEKTVRALAFAHLLNRYINAHIGKLSPMCSCVMSSSTAASAAMTYLLGGDDRQISWAIRNMSGTVTGMICDGGKVGCALKVSAGSTAALMCAITAVNNAALRVSDGICAETAEDCIRNMARVGTEGMSGTDSTIIRIMQEKQR